MNTKIRKLRLDDTLELANNIAEVWNTTYKGIVSNEFLSGLYDHISSSSDNLKKMVEDDKEYYCLVLDNKIIGWIYFTYTTENYEDTAEIHSLYVLEDYQGQGYGKELLTFAFKNIKNNDINKVLIGCLDGNESNEFYKHLGGVLIGNRLFRDEYLENLYLFNLMEEHL